MKREIRVLQINLQHAKASSATLCKRFQDEGIDVALLQEPYIYGNKVAGLSPMNGKVLYSGGSIRPRACIIHSNRVKCTLVPALCTGDIVTGILTATTEEGQKSWIICSAYFPGDQETCPPQAISDIVAYGLNKDLQIIIGCDANAHHTVWGSTNINKRGESLLQFILTEGLTIANVGNKPTFVTKTRQEVLDLTCCTSKVSDIIKNWHVSEEPSCSDHRQIRFDLDTSLVETKYRNPRGTNWQGFKESLSKSLKGGRTSVRVVEDIEQAVEQVNKAIVSAYHENCPEKTKRHNGEKTVWWNKNLERLRTEVRKLFNRAKDDQNWHTYKNKLTEYNKQIRKAKRDSWKRFCEEVNETPACSRIHKVLAKDGCTKNEVGFIKKIDGTYTETHEESNKELINAHFPAASILKDSNVPGNLGQRHKRPGPTDWKLATRVTRPNRIRWAISGFQPYKSPGVDGIYPVLLQKGEDVLIPHLCKVYRACLAWGYIPTAWQKVKVIYLPKVGRISDLTPKSYRPISLSSFLLKTLERLLDRYVRDEILSSRPLSDRQYAYQPGRSTDSALDDLNRLLSKSVEDKEIAVVTFLDIEGAFNNATTNSLVEALERRGVPKQLSRWIRASLEKRTIMSSIGEATIVTRAGGGCPQGGVLSPLLWAILVDDLLQNLSSADICCLGYADDLAIVVRGRFAGIISERTQLALNIVNNWCKKEHLSINASKTQVVVFTNKRALQGLKPPVLDGITIPFVQEAKYLGVLFDQRLTWNSHILKVANKASIGLGRCRRMCGKNWGLSPKMTLWLYTRVIRPMIAYGSIVWWPKTQQAGAIRQLESIQRQACLCVTGAMRTTPTAALEVLLNLPPLHIHIQGEARSVNHRLLQNQVSISQTHGTKYQRLIDELKADPLTGMPGDAMVQRYSFEKKYTVIIPERESWKIGLPVKAGSIWYTDGSKTEKGVGAGIYEPKTGTSLSMSLGRHTTVFQAEVAAVRYCIQEINRRRDPTRTIAIYSDSQAMLRALGSARANSKLVWDCMGALNGLGSHKKVTLAWVPGHEGHPGNEKADELARQGASKAFVGPEPFCGISKTTIASAVKRWVEDKFRQRWINIPGQRQTKTFIKGPMPKLAADLLSRDRKSVKAIVSLLTGHCRLNKHMSTIGLADQATCRFCRSEDETAIHILCHCDALARTRFQQMGYENPEAESYTTDSLSKLLGLVKKARLEEVIF